jgi:anthranilate phosphoribosyltransferase
VFNFLGPMANPARVQRQVLGVSDPAMAEKMIAVLEAAGTTHALVVYGHDGLDELTTTTTSTVLELRDGLVRTYVVDPAALGLSSATRDALVGGDASTNASLAHRVLDGETGAHRDIVVLNAAAGLVAAGLCDDLVDGIGRAHAAIDDGRASAALEKLVATSKAAAAG